MGGNSSHGFLFPSKPWIRQDKEDRRMAKGGRRRPIKRKRTIKSGDSDEAKNLQRVKKRERESRKSKSLLRQMRGMKWDEEEYSEELEEELEDV
jgi:hypothetical protein